VAVLMILTHSGKVGRPFSARSPVARWLLAHLSGEF
jgi:hypothetical protein